jgi:hypothetical protein
VNVLRVVLGVRLEVAQRSGVRDKVDVG